MNKAGGLKAVLVAVCVALAGCAAQKAIYEGDALLKQGKFKDAISAYEAALRIDPGNETAEKGIRAARRAAVRDQLREAKKNLSSNKYALALKQAMQARRMPLDLDDIALARRIDDTIAKAAQLAEERVNQWMERGQFVPAVELSKRIVDASPGMDSRQKWGEEVRAKAIGHYQKLAADLEKRKLLGSAAVQLAVARSLGAEVTPASVISLWNTFAMPVCFAEPTITVNDESGKAADLLPKIEGTARSELEALRAKCGEGTRPLGVTINLTKVTITDETKTEKHAKALPGEKIKTHETYFEEIPYKAMEEVTKKVKRLEKQERRDCAPRPGMPRGCRTWTEEVEVEVPVTKMVEVEKIKKIKKTRPIKGPLPPDKVLTYDVTTTTRRVATSGTIKVEGAPANHKFQVRIDSVDSSNGEAKHPKLTVKADPMEVKELGEVVGSAADEVSEHVKKAVAEAVTAWTAEYAEEANSRSLAGQMPQAEELYLRLLALGVGDNEQLERFFKERYGRPVGAVMVILAEGMGQQLARGPAGGGAQVEGGGFPKLKPSETAVGAVEGLAEASPGIRTERAVGDTKSVGASGAKLGMSDEDLAALEAASMEDPNAAAPKLAGPGEEGAAAGSDQGKPEDKDPREKPDEKKPGEEKPDEKKPDEAKDDEAKDGEAKDGEAAPTKTGEKAPEPPAEPAEPAPPVEEAPKVRGPIVPK